MKRGQKRFLFPALALVVLVQLACETVTLGSGIGRVDCEAKGGTWRQEVRSNGEVEEWCELPPTRRIGTGDANDATSVPSQEGTTPPSAAEASAEGKCVTPRDAYAWSYEDFRQSSGTGGVACNARFIFRNTSNEPLYLIVYTAWDNNAMQDKGWETYHLQPGGEWEERVNRTNYTDGVVTYSKVDRILVIRDAPECAGILSDESQSTWEAQASYIDEFTCP